MINKTDDKTKLVSLLDGEHTYIGWSEEGGGLVYKLPGIFVLFDIPQYGGDPRYVLTSNSVSDVLETVYSWT